MEPQNLPQNPPSTGPIPAVAVVPVVQNPPVLPQNSEPDPQKPDELYKNWVFWLLIVLVLGLVVTLVFLATAYFGKSFEVSVNTEGGVPKIEVRKLNAPTSGFLIVQDDENGIPTKLLEVGSFLVPDNYTNFFMPFTYDETYTESFYSDLLTNGILYVSFYTDSNKNGVFDPAIDVQIPSDLFGRKFRLKIIKGVTQQ